MPLPSAQISEELISSLERLINATGTAEGTNLPPRLIGGIRVPIVNSFTMLTSTLTSISSNLAQLTCVLSWIDVPFGSASVDHYAIYAFNLNSNSTYGRPDPASTGIQEVGVATAHKSPATLSVMINNKGPVIFVIQTVLNNGMTSSITMSPSVSILTDW